MAVTTAQRPLVSLREVFWLWAPLSLMWVLMALEGPMLQAVIARAAEPAFGLATYGYSFFTLLLFEAPVFMFLSASTALVRDRESFRRFCWYALPLAGVLSILPAIFALSGAFHWFNVNVVGLDEAFSRQSVVCLLILSPVTFLVGYRRMLQGVLVRARLSRLIAISSFTRIATAFLAAIALLLWTELSGSEVACAAMTISVLVETLCIHLSSRTAVAELPAPTSDSEPLSASRFFRFYLPLAFSSFVMIGAQPVLTFFIAGASDSKLSLAIWPVLMSFQFFFISFTLSLIDLVIAHYDEHKENAAQLSRFAVSLAVVALFLFGMITFSPLFSLWFGTVLGLSEELVEFLRLPAYTMIFLPVIIVWSSWLRGQLTRLGRTGGVTLGSVTELLMIVATMSLLLILFPETPGALLAIVAVTAARGTGCLAMSIYARRSTK